MIWNKERESLSDGKKSVLQSEQLKSLVSRVYEVIPFYRAKFDKQGIHPKDIRSIMDISKLPFTTKDDLRENYPFGMFAVPMERVVEIHTSSGTTGKPVIGGYTNSDIDMWSEVISRVRYRISGVASLVSVVITSSPTSPGSSCSPVCGLMISG